MINVLVREVPDEVFTALDARGPPGVAPGEYLRRRLSQEVMIGSQPVTAEDLARSAGIISNLGDPEVMKAAWE